MEEVTDGGADALERKLIESNREWYRTLALLCGYTVVQADAFAQGAVDAGLTATEGIRAFAFAAANEQDA